MLSYYCYDQGCDRAFPCYQCARKSLQCLPQVWARWGCPLTHKTGSQLESTRERIDGASSSSLSSFNQPWCQSDKPAPPPLAPPTSPPLPARRGVACSTVMKTTPSMMVPGSLSPMPDLDRFMHCGCIASRMLHHMRNEGKIDMFCATRLM